jgi:hypothetical protein
MGLIAAGLSAVAVACMTLTPAKISLISADAAGLWSTLPIYGQPSYCASTVSGTTLPASQGPYGVSPGSTQGTGSSICAQTIPAGPAVITGNEAIPADANLASTITTAQGGAPMQTGTIPSALLANMSGTPRNYLDNGSLNIQQRGVGIVTCGTTTTAVYGADRWACQTNVTSGAGRSSLVTTAALLPVGFQNVNLLYRTSGALTQPVCATQEISAVASTALAGKTVTLSVYEAALAGLAADNNNTTTLSVIYGTGSDQGIQTPSTSPLITPAWTGIGTAVNQAPIVITTTPTRYSVTGTIPTTATEVGVQICFTPTASGSGTTDGFAWTGAQLEVAPSPTAYEFHPGYWDLAEAQKLFYEIADNATTQYSVGQCSISTSSIANCLIQFPVTMRIAPTISSTTGFAASATTASTSTAACTGFTLSATLSGQAASTQNAIMDCASSAGFGAAGTGGFLWTLGSTTTAYFRASAEF